MFLPCGKPALVVFCVFLPTPLEILTRPRADWLPPRQRNLQKKIHDLTPESWQPLVRSVYQLRILYCTKTLFSYTNSANYFLSAKGGFGHTSKGGKWCQTFVHSIQAMAPLIVWRCCQMKLKTKS